MPLSWILARQVGVRYTVLMAKTTKTTAKKPVKKTVSKAAPKKAAQTVDFYPNRMGFAVASLAAVSLVLLGMIAMYS